VLDQLGIVRTHELVGLVAIEVKVERGHSAETRLLAHFLHNNSNSFSKLLLHDIKSFFFFFFFFFLLLLLFIFSFEYTQYPSIFLTGNSSTSTLMKEMSAKSSSYSASFGAIALQWLTQNGKING